MNAIENATHQVSDFFKHLGAQAADIIQHSPGIKAGVAGAGIGGVTTASSVSMFQIIGLCLTGTSVMIAAGSLYLGYLNYKERVRENNLKQLEDIKDEPNE